MKHGSYAPVPSTSYLAPSSADHSSSSASVPNSITDAVARNQVGAAYGPYTYPKSNRDSLATSRLSQAASLNPMAAMRRGNTTTLATSQFWDADASDLDDALHDPRRPDRASFSPFSLRGWANASMLFILVCGLCALFLGYPIATSFGLVKNGAVTGVGNTVNSTGQVPLLPGMPSLIDADTPEDAYSRTGLTDGKKYNLVFSDEFNVDGRSFYPGDDPWWEAVDLHYWPTGDLEWYDPAQVTTKDGNLVITMAKKENHDLDYVSGMIQGWNKFCFTTGYVEVKISLPGSNRQAGFWPGAWSMGNLGRAGYGATTEGTWPYSYDTCDVGTLKNQTDASGNPVAAATGNGDGGTLSYLPGQKFSACTCANEDHPGPSHSKGRAAPEIDIIEAQIDTSLWEGEVSQSFQIAPFSYEYNFVNTTPAATIVDETLTKFNTYKGSHTQQAVSALTYIPSTAYGGQGYAVYGYEWWSNPIKRSEGYITWVSDGKESWSMTQDAIGPDSTVDIGQRLIPEEPMYLILNLGMSPSFQAQDFANMVFPNQMYVDYVRVYQREDVSEGITCDPSSHPTADYINRHLEAYSNANLTTWAEAGGTFPKNSLEDGC